MFVCFLAIGKTKYQYVKYDLGPYLKAYLYAKHKIIIIMLMIITIIINFSGKKSIEKLYNIDLDSYFLIWQERQADGRDPNWLSWKIL